LGLLCLDLSQRSLAQSGHGKGRPLTSVAGIKADEGRVLLDFGHTPRAISF
jgi:hypothetical protein